MLGFDYGARTASPVRAERYVADLEGGAQAFAFASGGGDRDRAQLLDAGAHRLNATSGGTFRLFDA